MSIKSSIESSEQLIEVGFNFVLKWKRRWISAFVLLHLAVVLKNKFTLEWNGRSLNYLFLMVHVWPNQDERCWPSTWISIKNPSYTFNLAEAGVSTVSMKKRLTVLNEITNKHFSIPLWQKELWRCKKWTTVLLTVKNLHNYSAPCLSWINGREGLDSRKYLGLCLILLT